MNYKGFTISFANIDTNRMYRTECATVGTYWPTFTAAALYVLTCIRQAAADDLNYTEINTDFRELLRKHDGDTEINNPAHMENARRTFAGLESNDEPDEYEQNLAATIYNAWDELCTLYAAEHLADLCDWFFGATQEEASSTEENNPWDVYVAPKGI